jgi:hypothetical protein
MNVHSDIQRMLAVYPSLDGVQQRAVDAHVRSCLACAEARSAYLAMDQQIADLDALELPPALSHRWSGAVREWPRRSDIRSQSTTQLWQRVVLPIVLLLALAFGVWLLTRVSSQGSPGIAETPSVTPTATPALKVLEHPIELAMVAHEPRSSSERRPRPAGPPGSGELGIAPAAGTPAALGIPMAAPVTAFRGNP